MAEGKVVSYDPDSQEGDIEPDSEDHEKVPFYSDGFKDPATKRRLKEGDRVRFDIVGGMTGLMCTDIELLGH
jgi:cold shock CspA family protein